MTFFVSGREQFSYAISALKKIKFLITFSVSGHPPFSNTPWLKKWLIFFNHFSVSGRPPFCLHGKIAQSTVCIQYRSRGDLYQPIFKNKSYQMTLLTRMRIGKASVELVNIDRHWAWIHLTYRNWLNKIGTCCPFQCRRLGGISSLAWD